MENKSSFAKSLIWLLLAMLLIGFGSLLIVGAYDEGMMGKSILVEAATIIFKFLYFPFWYINTNSNGLFLLLYFINIMLWASLFISLIKLYKAWQGKG